MTEMSQLAQQVITTFQQEIASMGYTPLVHFELEGVCIMPKHQKLHAGIFDTINQQLAAHNIEANIVDEYWHNQWEYVSKFNGQSPLEEATYLARALTLLPDLFRQQGAQQTLIQPVVWSGDSGQLALGSKNIFTSQQRAVHIPNAIQINVSVIDKNGQNLVAYSDFGEMLQSCFMNTSLACCLLFLPEADAFERLALKSKYGLADELCSPTDISGGHQGSIALYKQQGKHNQPLGLTPLVVDKDANPLVTEHRWQKTARVEHRLGASSYHYNPYVNVAFALANVLDALELFTQGVERASFAGLNRVSKLPDKIFGDINGFDAITLFKQDSWFIERINRSEKKLTQNSLHTDLGQRLHRSIVKCYQPAGVTQPFAVKQAN